MSDDDDDSDGDIDQQEEPSDIGKLVRGSNAKGINTARSHFTSFLQHMHTTNATKYPYAEYNKDVIPPNFLTQTLFGQYATFLIDIAGVKKVSSFNGYISKTKKLLKLDYGQNLTLFDGDSSWYTQLRSNALKKYVERLGHGEKLVDNAPPLTENDLRLMCEMLMEMNGIEANEQRCMLAMDVQLLGRISEIKDLKYTRMSFVKNKHRTTLNVGVNRKKQLCHHDLGIVLHATDWLSCVFHSLGTMIAVNKPIGDETFPSLQGTNESQYCNRLFLSLFKKWEEKFRDDLEEMADERLTKKLTSHSPRSGGAQTIDEHPQVNPSWIAPRGGWTIDRIQAMFTYICGNAKTDLKVARVLSGWPSTDAGGICPTNECIAGEDQEEFKRFASILMGSVSSIPFSIKIALTCVLLLHHRKVEATFPNHRLVVSIYEALRISEVTKEKMSVWQSRIEQEFIRKNGQHLNGSHLGDSEHRSTHELLQQLCRGMAGQTEMLVSLTQKVEVMEKTMENLVQLVRSRLCEEQNHGLEDGNQEQQQVQQERQQNDNERREHLPPEFIGSIADLTISSLLFKYYLSQWMRLQIPANTPERRRQQDFTRMIVFMKRFLPDGSVIPARPNSNNAIDHLQWSNLLASFGQTAQKGILEFLEMPEIRKQWCTTKAVGDDEAGGQPKRKRKIEPKFSGIIKKLQRVDENDFPVTEIVDENF